MKDEITQRRKQTLQYWFIDGISEISFGVICLSLGVYFYIQWAIPESSSLYSLLTVGIVVMVPGLVFLSSYMVNYVKARITYPRTGYVSYPRQKGSRRPILAAVLGILFSLAFVSLGQKGTQWMPAITGLAFGLVWMLLGYRFNLWRFYGYALLFAAVGTLLSLSGTGNIVGLSYFYMLAALSFFVIGGHTLVNYMRSTSPLQEDNERGEHE